MSMNQVSTVLQRLADIDQSAINLSNWQEHITATYRQRERLRIEFEKNLHRAPEHYARLVPDLAHSRRWSDSPPLP